MKEIIYKNTQSERLDVFVSDQLADLSRSQIQKLIKSKHILVNNEPKKANYRLAENDLISIEIIEEETAKVEPINLNIEVIFEDEFLAIVNKPAGIVVYPGDGREEVSLNAALLGMDMQLSRPEPAIRRGIVHRLDKDTSGLMIIAKDNKTHDKLLSMFKKRKVIRKYYAMAKGAVEHDFGTIDAPIGRDEKNRVMMSITGSGKEAITYFKVVKRFEEFTLLECELTSGRTHQIRVHLRYIKHPVLGDKLYGKDKYNLQQQLLQSYYLEFKHPYTKEIMKFEIDVRDDFEALMHEWS